MGLPVLRALSLCTCCRHYPGTATGGTASLIRPVVSAFPERVVGSACASTFSRLAQRSLALRPAHSRCHQFVARLPEGFSHFVTSMTAPVASGWSGCRVGLAPTGKRRLFTAHTRSSRCAPPGVPGGVLARMAAAGQKALTNDRLERARCTAAVGPIADVLRTKSVASPIASIAKKRPYMHLVIRRHSSRCSIRMGRSRRRRPVA